MKDKSLFVVDGTYYLRRNFHACNKCHVSGTFAKDDQPAVDLVQDPMIAVISFMQTILKYIREDEYKREVIIAWDRGTYRYRPKETYTDYKSDRVYDDSFQACWDANNFLVEWLRTIGIHSIQVGGVEADDLGYYFSHASDDVVLSTVDEDWRQSLRPTTKIHYAGKKIITYEEVMVDGITEPRDLAIRKSIVGKHDNLKPVNMHPELDDLFDAESLVSKTIRRYKERTLPQESLEAIDYNMNLARLDRIASDQEVHWIIQDQLKLTKTPVNKIDFITKLAKIPKYPGYFMGVLSKYNKLHTY